MYSYRPNRSKSRPDGASRWTLSVTLLCLGFFCHFIACAIGPPKGVQLGEVGNPLALLAAFFYAAMLVAVIVAFVAGICEAIAERD